MSICFAIDIVVMLGSVCPGPAEYRRSIAGDGSAPYFRINCPSAMNATSVLTLSLVILFLPLLGFIIQLLAGRTRTPLDYVADPHESAGHDRADHGNPADAATADHTQHAADDPQSAVAHIAVDHHTAHADHHDEYLIAGSRGPWTESDQRRAYRLSWISTAIMGICLALAVYVAWSTFAAPLPGGKPSYYPKAQASAVWVDFGDAATNGLGRAYTITLGVLADNISAIMLVVVTLVSLLVHLFSSEYMRAPSMHGGRFNRYYAFLGLFTFSMLGIVIANNLLMIYIFWELVGLSSYLLIGFWYERPAPQYASMKAFITNRIGDIGMFAGILILYTRFGTLQLTEIFDVLAATLNTQALIPLDPWITAAGILLFCGAIGKSAQFPLNVWLPDAMEGPTPVSALIHAATMVAAGLYLTARIFPLLDPNAMLFIAGIGAATAFIASTIAMVQWDLKKVLAFSTVSQLGYMVMALGVGAYSAAIFHLVTHAMFKASLFLGAGSVIHQMHGALHAIGDHDRDPQDMRNMGGLRRKMPWTYRAMLVATLAISGIPLFSGYMSKDEILVGALAYSSASQNLVNVAVVIIGYMVAGMTAFYMFRMIFLTFWGEPRASDLHARVRENRRIMIVPVVVLAALSLWLPFGLNPLNPGAGWFLGSWATTPSKVVRDVSFYERRDRYVEHLPPGAYYENPEYSGRPPYEEVVESLHKTGIPHVMSVPAMVALAIAIIGIGVAFFRYGRSGARGQIVSWARPRGVRAFLFNRWYQDNIYEKVFPVGLTILLMKMLAWFDQNVIDGVVNGVASATSGAARLVAGFDTYVVDGVVNMLAGTTQFLGLISRQLQTGRIQTYVIYVVLGVVVLFFAFIQ